MSETSKWKKLWVGEQAAEAANELEATKPNDPDTEVPPVSSPREYARQAEPSHQTNGPVSRPATSASTYLPAAILAIASATLVLAGQFTPMYESLKFLRVAQNTLLQNGAGWGFTAAAGTIVFAALFGRRNPPAASWVVLLAGLSIVAAGAYFSFSEEARTLTAALPATESPSAFDPSQTKEEVAVAGVGLYMTVIGGFGAIAASVAALWPQLGARTDG